MKRFLCLSMICIVLFGCKNKDQSVLLEENSTTMSDSIAIVYSDKTTVDADFQEPPTPEDAIQKTSPIKASTGNATVKYASFGDKFDQKNVMSADEMMTKYSTLKKGDTINVRFASNIKEVCKKKGCWMSMQLPNGKESFVRFKDYGFFVPLNASKSDAIVNGKAFLDVLSIEDQKHYAKDGGKSDEEIAMITKPKITYGFTADGVLIKP